MNTLHSKYIIIGAGLSGLTSAYELQKHQQTNFLILESRDRIGGRILTHDTIDLGATWYQNHHSYLDELIQELDIDCFEQFSKGNSILVYSSMAPAHYFKTDINAPAAKRINKGSSNLIKTLAQNSLNKIILNTKVLEIKEEGDYVTILTNHKTYTCEKIIITIPPKLVKPINFTPKLPDQLEHTCNSTHTWMSNAIKVGLTFKTPFWRNKNLSGTIIGQIGAVTELYDHCNIDDTRYGLKGFVNEALRDLSFENRKETILSYLETYLGKDIRNYVDYYEKDWSKDENTSCNALKSVYMSPSYGNPIFQNSYMNGKLVFSGAETSPIHGGYMDGAVFSGKNAIKILLNL